MSDSGENECINLLFFVALSVSSVCAHIAVWMLLAGELAYHLYAWNSETMELPTSSLHR